MDIFSFLRKLCFFEDMKNYSHSFLFINYVKNLLENTKIASHRNGFFKQFN